MEISAAIIRYCPAAYPIETAVRDAIFYHAQCSLVAGMQELALSVQLAKDPGLDAVARTLLKFNIGQEIATRKNTNAADLLGRDTTDPIVAAAVPGTTPTTAVADVLSDPVAAYGTLLQAVASAQQSFVSRVAAVDIARSPSGRRTASLPRRRQRRRRRSRQEGDRPDHGLSGPAARRGLQHRGGASRRRERQRGRRQRLRSGQARR